MSGVPLPMLSMSDLIGPGQSANVVVRRVTRMVFNMIVIVISLIVWTIDDKKMKLKSKPKNKNNYHGTKNIWYTFHTDG